MAGEKAIKVKNGGGNPLPPMQALQEPLSSIMQDGPASCELNPQFRQRIAALDRRWDYGVSPDRTKAFLTQIKSCLQGGADRLIIDIWNLKTFTIEQQFSSEDLAAYLSGSNSTEDGTAMNYRQACFIDNEHIAFCTMTGHLCLLSVDTGEIILKKKVGDLLTTVASCLVKDIFAVSIFPRVGFDELHSACGVKLFSLSTLIKRHELELIEYISYGRGEPPFSVLPHRINFSGSGERMLLKGAALRQPGYGYTDYVEISDLSNRPAVTIHERDNEKQVVDAAISANHHTVVVDRDSITFFDQNQNEISHSSPLPQEFAGENGCRNCLISDDGSKALVWRKGVVYLFAPDREPRRCFAELGFVLDIGWSGADEVAVFVSQSDSCYHLCRIDLESMAVIGNSINSSEMVEMVLPRAVAVSHDGCLFIGDRQANLRVYNPNLTLQKSIKMSSGTINQLVADRFQDRIAVLMASQELKILSPEDCDLKTYFSRRTNKPFLAGSGLAYTYYPLMEGGELLLNFDKKNISLQCDNIRNLYIKRGKKQVIVNDGCGDDEKIIGKLNFPAPVVAAVDCYRHIIFVLADGSLLALDPYDFELEEVETEGDEKPIKPEGEHIVMISEGIELPLGLAAAGPGRIVLWTENEVILFTLAADFSISKAPQRLPQTGVKNVVYDAVNGRIILVKSHYLSFCTEDLKEMYMLSILNDGRSIIEVPYPELAGKAHNLNHPGFIWSSDTLPPDPVLFAVLDGNGQVVADDAKCRDFLEVQVFNEFMVREATSDYQGFMKMLVDAGGETPATFGSEVKTLSLPVINL